MPYDPEYTRQFYEPRAQKEWDRLESTNGGRLTYIVHRRAIEHCVRPDDRVLELGAGSGRFTQDLARITPHLTVTDLSPAQLEFNKRKMTELGLAPRVEAWMEADICDLSAFPDASRDAVVCIGGALNYVFEKESAALAEMLRILRTGGVFLLGVASLASTVNRFFGPAVDEFLCLGQKATDWVLTTGMQDGVNYKALTGHYMHMMRSKEVYDLCSQAGVIVEKAWCGGYLAGVDETQLQRAAAADPWLWERLVKAELDYCESPGLLEAGTHMIFAIRKH